MRGSLAAAAACLALLAFAVFSPRFIPYCMDEFAHYQTLGCAAFPLTAKWTAYREGSVFREGCGSYDLRLPFTDTPLPLRAYRYIGSLPALPFLPFWAIGDPVAARLQGAFFLVLASALLSRLTGARFLDLLLAACLFPAYALAFVVDLGPVGLSLVLLALVLLSTRAAVRAETRRRQLFFATSAGLLFFLGFWTKLVFAWTIPALVLWAYREQRAASQVGHGAGTAPRWVPVALAAALPSLLLLSAIDVDGVPYLGILREGNFSVRASAEELGPRPFLRLSRYVTDGSFVLPRILVLPHLPLDVAPLALATASLALALRVPAVRQFLMMAAATGLAAMLTRNAWGPHHAAFALFFVVGALGMSVEALRRRERRAPMALSAGVLLYWLTLAARLPAADINAETSFGKDALLRYLRTRGLDRSSVQAHTSWGTYYIALLFGDRQQITLWAPGLPAKPEMIAEVKRIAAAEKRAITMISIRRVPQLVTPSLRAALGAPSAIRQFDGWWLVEFTAEGATPVGR